MTYKFFVHGRPAPQGSKRAMGRGIMIEQSKYVASWRQDVYQKALQVRGDEPLLDGPLFVNYRFLFLRPKSHYNKWGVKSDAPIYCAKAPDLSKLVRATEDALTGSIIVDDRYIVSETAIKVFNEDEQGCWIRIGRMTDPLSPC